jgi:heat shock protein HslJ
MKPTADTISLSRSIAAWSPPMPSNSRRAALALVVTVFCLVGCSRGTSPPVAEPAAAKAAAESPSASTSAATTTAVPQDVTRMMEAYQWQLTSAMDGTGKPLAAFFPPAQQPLGILVGDGRVSVTGSCNRISAAYRIVDGQRLDLDPAQSTMMQCPPPLAAADSAMAGFLRGALQVSIAVDAAVPRLRLTAPGGEVLVFDGTPTPETRFGTAGTRAFLEVSPESCDPPAPGTCLRVRDRFFDENGLSRDPPSEWRTLPDGIEGYAPVAGEQHVVRVKRFEQTATNGSDPVQHFVFDMIVETRTVQ